MITAVMTLYCHHADLMILADHQATVVNRATDAANAECILKSSSGQLTTILPCVTWNVLVLAGVALAGILAVLHSCLDLKATIGGSQYHHIMYFLTPAMKPRMLMTVDKDMNLLPVSVRVGQAVDVVAQVRGGNCAHSLLLF